jgi:hypothetical protein
LSSRIRLSAAVGFSALAFAGLIPAQQMPPTGCGACVGGGGARSQIVPLIRVLGLSRVVAVPIHINLPPPPGTRDIGAIAAATEIVLGRNRKLRENLAVISAAARPPTPEVTPRPGEVLIRIASNNVAPPSRRQDIPKNAFEAMALRWVVYPQWERRLR